MIKKSAGINIGKSVIAIDKNKSITFYRHRSYRFPPLIIDNLFVLSLLLVLYLSKFAVNQYRICGLTFLSKTASLNNPKILCNSSSLTFLFENFLMNSMDSVCFMDSVTPYDKDSINPYFWCVVGFDRYFCLTSVCGLRLVLSAVNKDNSEIFVFGASCVKWEIQVFIWDWYAWTARLLLFF